MIVVTGAAGFIGSCVVAGLIEAGHEDLVLVDDFSREDKKRNHGDKKCLARIDRNVFFQWLDETKPSVSAIIHLGARTDTAEPSRELFDRLNVHYTQAIWNYCTDNQIPLIYASSAATYGDGKLGFADDHSLIPSLRPLNPYGDSKQQVDEWVLKQTKTPPFWAGLKFFNVYGPNEYHKGRMASVIFHAFRQIQETKTLRLFRSHHPDFIDGGQLRDFIYVKDAVAVILHLLAQKPQSAIYNLGTGQARTFLDLGTAVFKELNLAPEFQWIDTPADIRDNYQYFTEARMDKLRATGYHLPFHSLEEGIGSYVREYLLSNRIY
jgi:ADP-L-glycero-D-manno-heptose 6-epimerase